jgi:methylaspartate mutase epsilon subunit
VSVPASPPAAGLGAFVRDAAAAGELVVQPRMGMGTAREMAAGVRAVAAVRARTAATITIDSYTRVGDYDSARSAVASGGDLNGFPIAAYRPEVTARVAAAAGRHVPVQVRHGSALPGGIFAAMSAAGLTDTEGGPVSYCLPYGRTPLAESVARWEQATQMLAAGCRSAGKVAHLETFGGCLLGQLCPPSLLVAVSVLEALFFIQHGVSSVSLSYAQQGDPVQDIEALAALRYLAGRLLPRHVDWHIVCYTYMGVYPRTAAGARSLLMESVDVAVRGGAERLITKTEAEAHRIPTIGENIAALEAAASRGRWARRGATLPTAREADCEEVLTEAAALIEAVLDQAADMGKALRKAFAAGLLDVPFCLHQDNLGLTRAAITPGGRLIWADPGMLPLPGRARPRPPRVTSGQLLTMLNRVASRHDRRALPGPLAGGHDPVQAGEPSGMKQRIQAALGRGTHDDDR